MLSPAEILGAAGPLAAREAGFAPRPQQQEMAQAVADALERRAVLVAEAGTGTGKTFAYLVPALLCGRKVIVSTGTKNLQDQLFHKDLPVVREALGVPVITALLKGRANYLCLHRLGLAESEGRLRSRLAADEVVRVRRWAGETRTGDIAELPVIPEDAPVWSRVTSTADNCLGQDCPAFGDCFLFKARRAAQEADVVIINHHLLFAAMALREEGFGDLLPAADAFILDEAHQLAEVATGFFGLALSSNQLVELARDTVAEYLKEAGEGVDLRICADRLQDAVRDLRLALGDAEPRRGSWQEVSRRTEVVQAVARVSDCLADLATVLEPQAPRGKGLEACQRRCQELAERFDALTVQAPADHVHWFETHTRSCTLHLTPLDVSARFAGHMAAMQGAWIFTSATLAVGREFAHFTAALGLQEVQTRHWDSPFDYARQALLYLPTGLPDPASREYTEAVIRSIRPVLEASRGRAFLLFTSHRALQEAAKLLQGTLSYPLLVQGEAPRDVLLSRFRELGDAVLLGTSSFWEGVDVRGEALSCVVIDKLPFASPGDPIRQARIDAVRTQGGNPFLAFQLPEAVIALKQGAGRLIRDVADRGVLVLCDPRLATKPYGRVFLRSLPAMPRTHALGDVVRFFAQPGMELFRMEEPLPESHP